MSATGSEHTTQRVPAGTGPHVSALLPRGVLVAATVLAVAAQVVGREWPGGPLPALVPVLLALLLAGRPGLPLGTLVVGGPVLLALVAGDGLTGGDAARDSVTLLGCHLAHLAAALAAVLPAGTRLEVDALAPTWRRFLLVQGVAQAVLVLAVIVATLPVA
ncbi:hypothetical protein [Aquipuribacter nitratireducens]|uniref:Uncharacterized protein n=1 Tax=Aquipuribacter nitratireducens TaxID=650104 RepID=A0ABW0GJ61_9MICO